MQLLGYTFHSQIDPKMLDLCKPVAGKKCLKVWKEVAWRRSYCRGNERQDSARQFLDDVTEVSDVAISDTEPNAFLL